MKSFCFIPWNMRESLWRMSRGFLLHQVLTYFNCFKRICSGSGSPGNRLRASKIAYKSFLRGLLLGLDQDRGWLRFYRELWARMALQSLPNLKHMDQPLHMGWSLGRVHGLGQGSTDGHRQLLEENQYFQPPSKEYLSTEVGSKGSTTASTPQPQRLWIYLSLRLTNDGWLQGHSWQLI